MQVKIKTNLGTNQFPDMPYREGDVRDVPDEVGAFLVRKRWAEEVVQLKAVPPLEIKASPPVAAEQPAAVPATETSTPEVPAVKQKPKGGK